ncbi:MAG TPA: hypothetical protein VMJ73_12090 [Rhizomicrobium sp.]|nr:hypothetical protein [Rhizomicrobium sp.]
MRFILAAFLALATSASASPALPPVRPSAPASIASPFSAILQWTTDDLNAAIATANAATPPDNEGATCYGALLQAVMLVQSNGGLFHWPPTLVNDYEKAWLLHAALTSLKANTACATVCGRAATMLAVYGMGVNNFCSALAKIP